jgi:hypothetical protein
MLVFILATLLAFAYSKDVVCGLFSYGTDTGLSCFLAQIDLATGSNVSFPVSFCDSIKSTYPSFSTLSEDSQHYIVAITGDAYIRIVAVANGTEAEYAPAPVLDTGDAYLGLVSVNDGISFTIYLVSSKAIYVVGDGYSSKVFTFPTPLPAEGKVAASSSAIYFADSTSTTVYVIDLNSNFGISTISTTVSKPWDLQYSAATNELILLGSYQLYAANPSSGKTRKIVDIVDGSGYPKVNFINSDGTVFGFLDFNKIYTIALNNGTYLTGAPYPYAPRAVGFPVWASLP